MDHYFNLATHQAGFGLFIAGVRFHIKSGAKHAYIYMLGMDNKWDLLCGGR